MERELPVRLRNDPLVGVIFEVRFESSMPLSNILPGFLFNQLGRSSLMKTPAAEVPESIRNSDPNFAYVPVVVLDAKKYQVHIGDKVLQIHLNMPYQGWDSFKKIIFELYSKIVDFNVIDSISRFSLKYIDIVEPSENNSLDEMLNINFIVGSNDVNLSSTQFRTEHEDLEKGISIILQLAGSAKAEFSDNAVRAREGFLIDVDCIKSVNYVEPHVFAKTLNADLDNLHSISKNCFFSFLTDKGLKNLEPEYV